MQAFIFKYFGTQAKFVNFILKFALVFLVAQQIYFPQELKYFHLALLFVYIIFLEFFNENFRFIKQDLALVAFSLATAIVSIIETFVALKLATLYLIFLAGQNYLVFNLIFRIYKNIDSENSASIFTEKNQAIIQKGTFFIKLILVGVLLVLLLAFFYTLFYFFTT